MNRILCKGYMTAICAGSIGGGTLMSIVGTSDIIKNGYPLYESNGIGNNILPAILLCGPMFILGGVFGGLAVVTFPIIGPVYLYNRLTRSPSDLDQK